MMSQYRIQNQIAVYKTNKKLVEFNDTLVDTEGGRAQEHHAAQLYDRL